MKLTQIPIRDPFILPFQGKYYLFGTNGELSQSGKGFVCRTSEDLENWSEEELCFVPPADFWADMQFWAPEVHRYNGKFYMFASFYTQNKSRMRATQILVADRPEGPYAPLGEPATPAHWMCLDGTLYVENGVPYIVFCHEWVQTVVGEVWSLQLREDLSATVGAPRRLFLATDQKAARKTRSGGVITDGPWLHKTASGKLLMLWSTFSEKGYCQAVAISETGSISGPWHHCDRLLIEENGGHGMIFRGFDGNLYFTMHRPNSPGGAERAVLLPIREIDSEPYLEFADPE